MLREFFSLKKCSGGAFWFALYTLPVWFAFYLLNFTENLLITMCLAFFSSGITMYVFPYIQKRLSGFVICSGEKKKSGMIACFIIASIVALVILGTYYIAYYPGSYSYDSINQLEQVVNNEYNDWHPVIHTLLFFKLPLLIFGSKDYIVLFQIVCFSLLIGYLCKTIYKYSGLKFVIIAFAYIMLNPYLCCVVMYPWKDTGFAIFCTISVCYIYDIIIHRTDSLRLKFVSMMVAGICMSLVAMLRHNGILFVIPLFVLLIIRARKRVWITILTVFVLCIILVRGVVYPMLRVENKGNISTETSGLSLTVIGNVMKERPEGIDTDILEFANSICSDEIWNQYECGSFNSIKFSDGVHLDIVEKNGFVNNNVLALKCLIKYPNQSIKALVTLTGLVYGIGIDFHPGIGSNGIEPNSMGVRQDCNGSIVNAINKYKLFVSFPILNVFPTIGLALLFVVGSLMVNYKNGDFSGKIWLNASILMYDLVTMFLLTGHDYRFFIVTFTVCPMLVVVNLSKE